MTEKESSAGGAEADRIVAEPSTEDQPTREEPLENLTYEGTQVPRYMIVVWLVFFVWGLVYLLTLVPASVREWFLGK